MTRTINAAGRALIKMHEGLALGVYHDSAGILTIGYGHTGPDVLPGMRITEDAAELLLSADFRRFEVAVEKLVIVPLNDNQFSALVAFTFNVGVGSLEGSSLRRLLNAGDYGAVPGELARWNRCGVRIMAGLVARRAAEIDLWRTPIPQSLETIQNRSAQA